MARIIAKAALWPVLAFAISSSLPAQTLTLSQALDAAVQHHPAARGAALQVQQQTQLLPGAAALANPVVTAESPTGDFYTFGVAQSFEMPGVYRHRKDLQKSQIARAESGIAVIHQDIRHITALVYNELQYRTALTQQLREQDSLLQIVAAAAARQFEQGQIDAVANQLAALQATMLRARLHQSEQDVLISERQLQSLTGVTGRIVPEPWVNPVAAPLADTTLWQNTPSLQTLRQEIRVTEQQVAVEKSKGGPQITLGYLNQGDRNSPVANRFNAGVSIPLWRKQYQAQVAAAQTGVEIARQNLAAESLQISMVWSRAFGEAEKARLALEDYEKTVLPAARLLADASRRLYEGGLTDLPAYLRNRKDALDAQLAYLDLLRAWQEAQLNLRFIAGIL